MRNKFSFFTLIVFFIFCFSGCKEPTIENTNTSSNNGRLINFNFNINLSSYDGVYNRLVATIYDSSKIKTKSGNILEYSNIDFNTLPTGYTCKKEITPKSSTKLTIPNVPEKLKAIIIIELLNEVNNKSTVVYAGVSDVFDVSNASNMKITLKKILTEITITYDANGGEGYMANQTVIASEVIQLNENKFTRTEYRFYAWNTTKDGKGSSFNNAEKVAFEKDIKLYAQWILEENYSITYNLDGGINSESNPISYNSESETIILQEATKNGYDFVGWFDDNGNLITEIVSKSIGNISLTARWQAHKYTVSFNANGGTGEMPDMNFTYDEEKSLILNSFVYDDFTFIGWAIESDGEVFYDDGQKISNLTHEDNLTVVLYAIWMNDKVCYVDGVNGNDENKGTEFKPLKTMQKAVDSVISKNDGSSEYIIYLLSDCRNTNDLSTANNNALISIVPDNLLNLKICGSNGTRVIHAGNQGCVMYIDEYANVTLENITLTGGKSFNAGGVVVCSGGIFNMNNGTTISNCNGDYSGGIMIYDGGIFNMNGGKIKGCKSDNVGSAVYVEDGTFNISGSAVISSDNDVYLASGMVISISDSLTASTSIATITLPSYTEGNQVLEVSDDSLDIADYFTKFNTSNANWCIDVDGTIYNKSKVVLGAIAYGDGYISRYYDPNRKMVGYVIKINTSGKASLIVSIKEGYGDWYVAESWCENYSDASGNYDWMLPQNTDNFKLIYNSKDAINKSVKRINAYGGNVPALGENENSYYWGPFKDINYGYCIDFSGSDSGYLGNSAKTIPRYVRAIRGL